MLWGMSVRFITRIESSNEISRRRPVTTENQFYRRHYGGGVEVGATPLDVFEREVLAAGKRYARGRVSLRISR